MLLEKPPPQLRSTIQPSAEPVNADLSSVDSSVGPMDASSIASCSISQSLKENSTFSFPLCVSHGKMENKQRSNGNLHQILALQPFNSFNPECSMEQETRRQRLECSQPDPIFFFTQPAPKDHSHFVFSDDKK